MGYMSKRFDLDIGKRRARKRMREFIKTRVYNRRHARVLCLPGGQGLEIHQIYRWLEIPDENIYGVERDPESARLIRLNYPRINLFEGGLVDFINQYEGEPFSIVSLDFCGHLDTAPLAALVRDRKIADRAVVAFNILAGREDAETQAWMRSVYAKKMLEDARGPLGSKINIGENRDLVNDILSTASSEALKDVRDDFLTYTCTQTMSYHIPTAVVTVQTGMSYVPEGHVISLLPGNVLSADDDGVRISNAVKTQAQNISPAHRPALIKHLAIQSVADQLVEAGVDKVLNPRLRSHGIDSYYLGRSLVMAWYDKYSYPYFTTGIDRFSYISDSGKRMVTDLYEVRTLRDKLDPLKDGVALGFHKIETDKHQFFLSPDPSEFKTMNHFVEYICKVSMAHEEVAEQSLDLPKDWPDREDLGGGWQIPMNAEKIKAKVVEMIKKGRTVEEIADKYPTLGVGTIRAIKAHHTMGSYDD